MRSLVTGGKSPTYKQAGAFRGNVCTSLKNVKEVSVLLKSDKVTKLRSIYQPFGRYSHDNI